MSLDREDEARFSLFAAMWAAAGLFHSIHRSDLVASPLSMGVAGLAMVTLLFPSRPMALAGFCLARAALFVNHAPNVGNHEFLAFAADCSIVLCYAAAAWRKGASDTTKRMIRYVAPLLRSYVVILYFFAVFHKLNTSYFQPESCGGTLLRSIVMGDALFAKGFGWLPWDSEGWRYLCIYGSLMLEIAIPALLLWRRFAWVGCLVGLGFHGLLGLLYFWHFTPVLLALYGLFLPNSFSESVWRLLRPLVCSRRWKECGLVGLMGLLLLYLAKGYVGHVEWELGRYSRQGRNGWELGLNLRSLMGWLPFLAYAGVFGALVWRYGRPLGHERRERLAALLWPVVALVFANGLCPYLGLKTHCAFAMFSGLRVTDEGSNHFFMPGLPLTSALESWVVPLGENHTSHANALDWQSDEMIPLYELANRVRVLAADGTTDIHLHYTIDEIEYEHEKAEEVFAPPVSWWAWRFRGYRTLPLDSCGCYY